MDRASLEEALGKIEAAVARLERASTRRNSEQAELQARHDALKSSVSQSLKDLDREIAGSSR